MSHTLWEHVQDLRTQQQCQVDDVVLTVDYQIIEHFSKHLYGSPNKAIEELVANGFDAFATQVHVFTPGRYTNSRVIVWDNGQSMDVEGLKKLWWIARSPKANGQRIEEQNGHQRKIIGKFGIGKLASYSVGRVISHVCRHHGQFYVVSIDYAQVEGSDDGEPVSSEHPVRAPIVQLNRPRTSRLVRGLFDQLPSAIDSMLDGESWTFAVIEELKITDLPQGRLMWVLGNGMPLRPDFGVKVNDIQVTSRLDKKGHTQWDFGTTELTQAIRGRWDEARKRGDIGSTVRFGHETGLDPSDPTADVPYAEFTRIGRVWGRVRLFDSTLLSTRNEDHGRSHGFFLMVRGRLVNPDEDQLFLPDPSFQTFYRSQFVLHADDLDDALLADRQGLREEDAVRHELGLLQRALAAAARATIEARDERTEADQSTQSILPVGSRLYYRDPLNALLLREAVDRVSDFDPGAVRVERKALGSESPISEMAVDENLFYVNSLHPYYGAVESRAGKSRAAQEFFRTFDLFAVSERLLEGHLLDIGLSDRYVSDIVEWREGLFRRLAASYERGPEVIAEMWRSSHLGGRSFEKALQRVFQDMGFSAEHDGASGEKDVLVLATVGPESFRFVVEAKGSKGEVGNQAADVGAAANHRDRVGADHAVIVARKFVGFGAAGERREAALYGECQSTGNVSIMEVEALENVHRSIVKFSYPLPLLRDIFTKLDTPAEKRRRIEGLTTPGEGFDYGALLKEIWRRQGDTAAGDVVAYRSVYQEGGWKKAMEFDDFQRRLVALETFAAGRIRMNMGAREVYLRQSPELILMQIEKALYGDGHDFDDGVSGATT